MAVLELNSTTLINDANLVSYYRFEGNSNDTKGTQNGTDTSVTYGTNYGVFGQGALFNAAGDKIDITNNAFKFAYNQAFSISAWIKKTADKADNSVFVQQATINKLSYQFGIGLDGKPYLYLNKAQVGGNGAIGSSAITNSTWNHICGTFDGSTGIKMYVNGILTGTGTYAQGALSAPDSSCLIGNDSDNTTTRYFDGAVDDLSVFSRALTHWEIQSLYTGASPRELNSTILRSDGNLVQYDRFEGNSTATVGNNGTDTTIAYGTVYGIFGQGSYFNGTSSKITLTDTGFPSGNSDRSICAWIKLDAIGAERTILDYGSRANYQDIAFDVLSTGKLWMDIYNEGKGGNIVLSANTWYHVAVSYVGSTKTATFYVNGVADTPVTYTNTLNTTLSTSRIGCLQTDAHYFFNGSIEDLAVFSRALTATEVSNLYDGNWPATGFNSFRSMRGVGM